MAKPKRTKFVQLDALDVSPFGGNIIEGTMAHLDICEEYFAYIKHLCIKAKYKEAFEVTEPGEEYRAFQTFIQQSYEYYKLAKLACFEVVPVCYYYSFLNLMKAYLAPKHWNSSIKKFSHHGLQPKIKHGSGVVSDYLVIKKGIFSLAIDVLMGKAAGYENREINVREMFWYLPSIELEISELYDSSPRYIPIVLQMEVGGSKCDIVLKTFHGDIAKKYRLPPKWSPRKINPNLQKYFKTKNKKGDDEWEFRLRNKLNLVDDMVQNNEEVIQEIRRLLDSLASCWYFSGYDNRTGFLIPYTKDFVLPVELVILSTMF
ncbi:MAG: YaaC family protein, partial [Planctomycetota bacterium]